MAAYSRLVVLTLIGTLVVINGYSPCPDGYYWIRPLEKCEDCNDICSSGPTPGCSKHCPAYTFSITTTSTPTTPLSITTSPSTVVPIQNTTNGEIYSYIIAGTIISVVLLMLVMAFMWRKGLLKCRQKRVLKENLPIQEQNQPSPSIAIPLLEQGHAFRPTGPVSTV